MEKRTFEIDIGEVRSESRTVAASLSSEFPVKRYDGDEVLSHDPAAVDLSRDPLPLLRAHDNASLPVGVVESLQVQGGKLRGVLRLSASQDGIWQDIKDGILRNLSIGYRILEKVKTKTGYIATKWQPYECSLVAAPADNTIGIGRTLEKEIKKMDKNDVLKAKKQAVDELAALASTGEDTERMETLKGEIRTLDSRLDAFDMVEKNKPATGFKPEKTEDRRIITFSGGPAVDRSFKGMFGEIRDENIELFRASMVEGVPSSGGFSVPEPLAAKWLDDSLPNETIRPRATVWSMESATRKVAGWDGADQSGGSYYGGFEMEFLTEEGTGNKQTGKLRAIELAAKKGAIFVDASAEVIEDGLGFESQLEMAVKKSLSLGMDYYFLQGNGAGQPLGVLSSPGVVTVTKEAGQDADTIVYENLAKMFARMYPAGRSSAVWIANETAIPSLLMTSLAVGTGGGPVNLFQTNSGEFNIFGRPVIFTPNLPAVGDTGDILFVDLRQYAIGIRRDMRIEKSNIPGWTQDLVSFRVIVRFDGQGTWSDVITPRNGDSLGWCVKIEAR